MAVEGCLYPDELARVILAAQAYFLFYISEDLGLYTTYSRSWTRQLMPDERSNAGKDFFGAVVGLTRR